MKEFDIRPKDLFNRYLELSQQEVNRFFTEKSQFVEVSCPACNSQRCEFGLEKFSFRYVVCLDCGSLYLSPRPTSTMIDAYYRESEAVKFLGTHFFKETAEARRKKIFEPRAQIVSEWMAKSEISNQDSIFVDVGSGYGIFLEEVAKLGLFEKICGIEPALNLASICRNKGFEIIEKKVEEVDEKEIQASFATAFEVLEHLFDPAQFLKAVGHILRNNGIFLFTTLTVSGFDIQILWKHSKSIYPPHHINLLSFEGIKRLVERCGFKIMELNTPGKLDVDILINILKENPEIKVPRFVSYLLNKRGEITHGAFQAFLQGHNLSSHIRGVVKKEV